MARVSRLQRELQQNRPFRSSAHEAVLALFRTTDVLRRFFAERLQAYDVTLQQYNVLRILRGAGADGLPTLAIGERMVEQTPGITRLLDRLERRGWIVRVRSERDRRQVIGQLTRAGERLLAAMDDDVDEADAASLSALSEAQRRQLIRLLEEVRATHEPRSE